MQPVIDFLGRHFWLPLPFTAMHFAWCWFVAYPLYLEARIKDRANPKPWVYLPSWWKGWITRLASPLMLVLCLATVLTWTGSISRLLPRGEFWALGPFLLFSALTLWLQRYLLSRHYLLQRECYFRDYKRIASEAHAQGKPLQDSDLRNRCMWEHQQSLRKAEQSGRLHKYLHAKARSSKEFAVLDDNYLHEN